MQLEIVQFDGSVQDITTDTRRKERKLGPLPWLLRLFEPEATAATSVSVLPKLNTFDIFGNYPSSYT